MSEFRSAIQIKTLPDYKLWLKFDNGEEGIADLSDMVGKGVFADWNDPKNFTKAKVIHKNKVISWGNELDICVDSLYSEIINKAS